MKICITPPFILGFVMVALWAACGHGRLKQKATLNFRDTLYQKRIYSVNNRDTVWEYDTVYFAHTDPTIDTSGFYYTAYKERSDVFKVFFPRQKVIAYCDSMLQANPYKNQGDEDIFYKRQTYEHLKQQAEDNKMDDVIGADDLSALLERFAPLVLSSSGDKPLYLIVKKEEVNTCETETYNVKSASGDTIVIDVKVLRDIPLEGP